MKVGTLLIPLLEWRRDEDDRSLQVLIHLPAESFEQDPESFGEYLDHVMSQVKGTYQRCWEALRLR